MVITRISCGLGNQMFQYAAGRALALRNGAELKLDLTNYAAGDDREFGLDRFALTVSEATVAEITRINGAPPGERKRGLAKHLDRLARRLRPGRTVLREKNRNFDPEVLRAKGDLYLLGYWQSPKYFEDQADRIRADFQLKAPPSPGNQPWLEQVAGCESVAVHFRRGDYVGHPVFEMREGLAYYDRAIAAVRKRHPDARFYLFSDDPGWVRDNFRSDAPFELMTHNGNDAYEDLRLMAACRHQIIANSSFSWWAAWLNPNPGKLGCAPAAWFNKVNRDNSDMLPADWQVL